MVLVKNLHVTTFIGAIHLVGKNFLGRGNMETAKELRAGDEWQSQHEANFDNARDECMTEADNIVMEVEHIVHDLDQTLDVQNTLILAEAINKVIELRYYTYIDQFNSVAYDYDFTDDIKMVLQERLSFELEVR
tara:strand:- start:345 stop:746 length:402 start_codon:yes stop_codon:yes gene_type:complete